MIGLDTNLLVYAHRPAAPEHGRARAAIERAAGHPAGWGFTSQSVAEFWSVVTQRTATGRASKPNEALRFLTSLVDAGAHVWTPGQALGLRLARLAAALDVTGVRVFDLQIALTAFEAGARELWTHDAQFVTIKGLRLHDPLA